MNCDQAMRDILLESSGEIGAGARARLRAHLAVCPSCRSYRAALLNIEEIIHSEPAAPLLSTVNADTILTEATRRTLLPRRRFWTAWQPPAAAVAAAAVAVAFLAGFTASVLVSGLRRRTAEVVTAPAWSLDEWMDAQIDWIRDELSSVAHDIQRAADVEPAAPAESVDEVAARLLQLDA